MNFSVSLCVYDKDDSLYFKEALESIVTQKLLPTQVVITVDGPINKPLENEIKKFGDVCSSLSIAFTTVCLEKNRGHGEARRVGIEHCSYELVAIADADDLNDYERFYRQVEFFESTPDASVVGGQMMEIEHDTKKSISQKSVPLSSEELDVYLKRRCPMNQATVMFKKSQVLKAGGYIDFFHNEDYYLWIRMYLNGAKFYNLDTILVYVRVGRDYFGRRGGWNYFMSEYKIQKIMFEHRIIGLFQFIFNISVRFVIQLLLTDALREFIFKKLLRKKVKNV